MRQFMIATLSTALVLSACGPTKVMPERNEVIMDVAENGNTISGRYDPKDFTVSDIQNMMGFVCNRPGLPSFQSSQRAGLVHFSTRCEHGNSFGSNAGIDFRRVAPDRVSYKAIYSKNGKLTFDLGTLDL